MARQTFILDKIVIDENKKAIIIKFLDEEGRERWYVFKNILDSSTMERDEEDDWLVRIYLRSSQINSIYHKTH